MVGFARIFEDLPRPPGRAGVAAGAGADVAERVRGPRGCHDLTAYPALNLVAGSGGSFGILLDASDPERPVRLDAESDVNFSLWHTAVFGNDGRSVVFTESGAAGRSRAAGPPIRSASAATPS